MWTVSAIQMHPRACIVCDEDATMDLRVKTVNYFKGLQKTATEIADGALRMEGDAAASKKEAHAGGLFSPRGAVADGAGSKRKR